MFGKWYQIYVKGKNIETNNPQAMKRVDDTLTSRFPAAFVAPDGLPISRPGCIFEVRCFSESALPMVKRVLTDYHDLEIISIVENE